MCEWSSFVRLKLKLFQLEFQGIFWESLPIVMLENVCRQRWIFSYCSLLLFACKKWRHTQYISVTFQSHYVHKCFYSFYQHQGFIIQMIYMLAFSNFILSVIKSRYTAFQVWICFMPDILSTLYKSIANEQVN